ncbi:MAG: chemotaxis protein CheA [Pseudomonadota bacterium]
MIPEGSGAGELVDELSLMLVMVDPEDLIALGELLEKVEKLEAVVGPEGPGDAVVIAAAVRKIIEAIILEKIPDKNVAVEMIGRGVGLFQVILRDPTPGAVDANAWLLELREKTGLALPEIGGRESNPPAAAAGPADGESSRGREKPPVVVEEKVAAPTAGESRGDPEGAGGYDIGQDRELFFGFISESLEHIESIEVNIISLESDPEDKETLNAIFRPFHTIKGVSGFLNLRHIHTLTHEVENLLDEARNDRVKVSPALIDIVLDAVDILKRMIHDVKSVMDAGGIPGEDAVPQEFLERLMAVQQGEAPDEETAPPDISPYSGWRLGEILIDQGLIKDEELSRLLQTQSAARLRKLGELVIQRGLITPADLEEALRLQMSDQDKKLGEILIETGMAEPEAISSAVKEQESLRERRLGEILVREKQAGARDVAEALREQKKQPETAEAAVGRTVKVDTQKLDALVDLVGELVIAQSLVHSNDRIMALKDQKLFRDMSHMSRITTELQRTAMSMRMVPIRQTFQKMIRLVRDLSRKSGKQVDLTMSGEDTEIDRNMVEAIYDPLLHMVRNSVDHGIEYAEKRAQAGKPAEGKIHLRAFHQGGNVVIQIEDDGQGLDRGKILRKAVERGVISPTENLSEQAVFLLIFQPGFSTAEKVTDVSGRGVGMDVVKQAIEKLRGKIEVASRPGRGCVITIRLPLTLAIIDGMIVRIGESRFILPTVAIRESFRPTSDDYHTVEGRGEMIKVRESMLPLVRLGQVLETPGAVEDPAAALVVVVENEGRRRCLMVDEVLGKQEVVIKSLGERLKYVRALAGGSILGDGRVGLILDVAGLFEVCDGFVAAPPAGRVASPADWEMDDDWGMGPT